MANLRRQRKHSSGEERWLGDDGDLKPRAFTSREE
jgi:hypothetical protein